jgi:hypothetical protein
MRNVQHKLGVALAMVSAICLSATTYADVDAASIAQQLDDTALNFQQLHTYDELVTALYNIEQQSNGAVDVGPLIINGNNGGLLDIDQSSPGIASLREQVVNTVSTDSVSELGNTTLAKVGYSNFGKALMAAQFGNGPIKIAYITQQHGNEFIATEAALDVLSRLADSNDSVSQWLQDKISLLMIVRANPDGGEPDRRHCQIGAPFINLGLKSYDCAFYRFNIDATAGTMPTSDAFRGAVGVGYNLNRYHIANLDQPIRPVEAQAMVAAILAFQPNFVMDLHGDLPKVTCDIDSNNITEVYPGLMYDALCQSSAGTTLNSISIRDMAEFIGSSDTVAQRWNADIAHTIQAQGNTVGRHRQVNESFEITHTAGDYSQLIHDNQPVHTMLLEQRTLSPVADPLVIDLDFSQSPAAPAVDFALNEVLGENNYQQQKIISQWAMLQGMLSAASGTLQTMTDDNGYTSIAEDSGFIYRLSPITRIALGMLPAGPYLYPLCTFETCLGGE